jgi:hypothetical protein
MFRDLLHQNQKVIDYLEELWTDGGIILKWILQKLSARVWIGFIWL